MELLFTRVELPDSLFEDHSPQGGPAILLKELEAILQPIADRNFGKDFVQVQGEALLQGSVKARFTLRKKLARVFSKTVFGLGLTCSCFEHYDKFSQGAKAFLEDVEKVSSQVERIFNRDVNHRLDDLIREKYEIRQTGQADQRHPQS